MIPSDICSYPSDAIKKISLRLKKKVRKRTYKLKHYPWKIPKSVIPLHIYQIWHNLDEMPSSVKKSIQILKQQNPEFEHHLYDERMARNYIHTHFSKDILDAYDTVIPHALKADIWRYCVMYKDGGIYLDSKYYGINNFKFIYLTDKEYFCKDRMQSFYGIYNAIFICKPGNLIILKIIQQFVKNTKDKYYGHTPHCIGPLMIKPFFTDIQLNHLDLTHEYVNISIRFINYKGYRILKFNKDYVKDHPDTHWIMNWRNKTLYLTK